MNGETKILTASAIYARLPAASERASSERAGWKVSDYLELMKPELTSLSILTALCGYYLAAAGEFNVWQFVHLAVGTALVGGSAGTLNEYIERGYDALMRRTEQRPIPSGRVQPIHGFVFGSIIAVLGILYLAIFTNILTAFLGLATFALYIFLYTPLKRKTPYATLIGGIPGALPPVMGWTAARGEITIESIALFAVLFCWQMPHFFSLAWMYRKDYARAGFNLLTVVDRKGSRTARQILVYSAALLPASIIITIVGLSGIYYVVGAFLLGSMFLALSIQFARSLSSGVASDQSDANRYSRRIFFGSLVYLPLLLLLMSIDKV